MIESAAFSVLRHQFCDHISVEDSLPPYEIGVQIFVGQEIQVPFHPLPHGQSVKTTLASQPNICRNVLGKRLPKNQFTH